jgi:hypothetical protein
VLSLKQRIAVQKVQGFKVQRSDSLGLDKDKRVPNVPDVSIVPAVFRNKETLRLIVRDERWSEAIAVGSFAFVAHCDEAAVSKLKA